MKKIIYIIIVIIIVAVAAAIIWLMTARAPQTSPAVSGGAPSVATTVPESAQGIENYVNNIDVGSVNQQFQSIDQGINSL